MKKIVCELCEGTDFSKENGMFVCQGCGTKYSAEEAKSMMQEVEGDAPAAGTPVGTSAGNPNQQQIDNLLVLATNAYEANNFSEAESYCNKAIESDATCYKAWFLKGKAIGWSSTLVNNRIQEASHSFCQAIASAPPEDARELGIEAAEELRKLGVACVIQRGENFAKDPSDRNIEGLSADRDIFAKALMILLDNIVDPAHIETIQTVFNDYRKEIAVEMNKAGVAAINFVRKAWNGVEHPSDKDWETYKDWLYNIEEVFRQAIATSDNDDEEDIIRYKNLKIAIEEPMDKCSYKQEWNGYRYVWIWSLKLSDSAKDSRRQRMRDCDVKIAKLEKKIADKKATEAKKAEEEKQARIAAYWEAHNEEKAALDTEKTQLTEKKSSLDKKIGELDKSIKTCKDKEKEKGPSEKETDELKAQIKELEDRRAKLGLFAGKEKKQISEEIASLQGRIESLKDKVANEKKNRSEEIQKEIAPFTKERDELKDECTKVTKRIAAIDAELTKDPEE